MIDKKNLKLYFIVCALFLFIVSCNQDSGPVPTTEVPPEVEIVENLDNEIPLITDIDIENAVLEIDTAETEREIAGLVATNELNETPEEIDLSAVETIELAPQVVVSGAQGSVCYVRNNPGVDQRIYVHDQVADTKTLVLLGSASQPIESVACSPDGQTIVFARPQATAPFDYEIYRYTIGGTVTQLTSDPVQNYDVSMDRTGKKIAWVNVVAGKHIIKMRTYTTSTAFTTLTLTSTFSQEDPSMSGDGDYLTFVRRRPGVTDLIMVYNVVPNNLTTWFAANNEISDPSIADGAAKVAWRQVAPAFTKISTRTSPAGSVTTAVGNVNGIQHPHLAANGDYVTYGIMRNGSWDVFTRRLSTNELRASFGAIGPREIIYPYWQWSGSTSCVLGTGILGTCTLGP